MWGDYRSEYYKILDSFLFLFLPYLETGKKCRKQFSDSQSDLRDCAGSQKELDEISSGITIYRVFLQRVYCAKKRAFAARKWKNSCISFFLFFFSHFSFSLSPSWNNYNFFLGSFSLDFRLSSMRVTLWVHAQRVAEITPCAGAMSEKYLFG